MGADILLNDTSPFWSELLPASLLLLSLSTLMSVSAGSASDCGGSDASTADMWHRDHPLLKLKQSFQFSSFGSVLLSKSAGLYIFRLYITFY